jgi:pilus assembly protein CpaB
MTTKRIATALFIALLVSGLFTYLLSRRVTKNARTNIPRKTLYVAAGKVLDAGESLKPENLQLVDWNTSTPLTEGFSKISDVAGRVVLYPLAKGEPIIERQLASVGAGAGITASIPAGMRAISVRSDEVVGVAGFLLPGTHVDVLMTFRSDTSPEPRTATVLQDVVVLAAGQQIHPDPSGKPASVNVVTLLLRPEDAEKLVLATSLGGMHFVLRNGADRAQMPMASIGLGQLTGVSPSLPGVRVSTPTRRGPATKANQYEVETFMGDKRVVRSFH